ncbi:MULTISPECIES: DUF3313 domain-containing protein [Methylococcus]|uniref:DUF3313 domain-containing protein n=1 Tax=Methylococcus capsulatus TaxID=414 RepID=A0ABZ2F6M8_METCP|nr:DUF3313 domain-containing protein [Methylococcus capsulatus]
MRISNLENGSGRMPSFCDVPSRSSALLAVVTVAFLCGCSATKQARDVEPSGFLGSYSSLRKGNGNEPLLVYANPAADCRKYTKVMIDPVTLWAKSGDSWLQKLKPEDRDMLRKLGTDTLLDVMNKARFEVVSQPGPDVMRVRMALTEADKANVLLKEGTVLAPYVTAPAALYSEAAGQALFTGDAAFELELLDSQTGQRLYAAADKRVGKLDIRDFHEWDDVKEAFKSWGERGARRLVNCRTTGSFVSRPAEQSFEEKIDNNVP